jgi:hypothetical protein
VQVGLFLDLVADRAQTLLAAVAAVAASILMTRRLLAAMAVLVLMALVEPPPYLACQAPLALFLPFPRRHCHCNHQVAALVVQERQLPARPLAVARAVGTVVAAAVLALAAL